MSSAEADDLFGDGDDLDSLFDGDDVHLFDAPDDEEDKQTSQATPSIPGAPGTSNTSGISLPSVPDPHGALSCDHVGLTSGQHTVSTHDPSGNAWGLSLPENVPSGITVDARALDDPAIDTFPIADFNHGDQVDHEHQRQAVLISPQPSPSQHGSLDELAMFLENQLPQEQGSQPEIAQVDYSSMTAHEDVNDWEMRMEYEVLHDQATRATTTALGDPPAYLGIGLAATEHRWANAKTRQGIRIPRRIDLEGANVDVLKNYVTLSRGHKLGQHYERLQLAEKAGKLLTRDLRDYLRMAPDGQQLREQARSHLDEKRHIYLSAALRLLKHQGWGNKWFGPSSPRSAARPVVWPVDSTILVLRFAPLVYKIAGQERYDYERRAKAVDHPRPQKTLSDLHIDGISPLLPIDLTVDGGDGMSGSNRGLTPNTSVTSSRPTSSHRSLNQALTGGLSFSDLGISISSRPSCTSVPRYRSPAFRDDGPDFYVMEDMTPASLTSSGEPSQTNSSETQSTSPPNGISLEMLAEQVAYLKQRKKPETHPVKYRLTFTDTKDTRDLRPPLVGVLADDMIKGDRAVRTLKSAFQKAGVPATIYIKGENGPIEVTAQEEWNEAVHAAWEQHGDGAVVEVGIHV